MFCSIDERTSLDRREFICVIPLKSVQEEEPFVCGIVVMILQNVFSFDYTVF